MFLSELKGTYFLIRKIALLPNSSQEITTGAKLESYLDKNLVVVPLALVCGSSNSTPLSFKAFEKSWMALLMVDRDDIGISYKEKIHVLACSYC